MRHSVTAVSLACAVAAATPASAQFYYKMAPYEAGPVEGDEPGLGLPLPGATTAEYRAALIWNLRSALNVAALQCQFAPELNTLDNYNDMLTHHKAELKTSFDTLEGYFKRTSKTAKEAQMALDTYGTKTYSSFSTVGAQLSFCQAAGYIGRDTLFVRKGALLGVAQRRMRELRSSLIARRELQFHYYVVPSTYRADLPNLDPRCWNKKNIYDIKRCPWSGYARTMATMATAAATSGANQPL